ncbi:MAG: hypothetical protein ACXV7J_08480 [Methylomonas sp.]
MAKTRTLLLATGMLLAVGNGFAAETKISVPMDYRLIRNVLATQLYTGAGETARVWQDGKQCSFLDMSNPKINGENGQVKIDNDIHARIGMTLGKNCIPAIEWSGVLETFQQPTLDAAGNVLSFPVTRATAFDRNGQQLNIGQLQDLINKAVQPKLGELKIDLNEQRDDIVKTLLPYIDADDTEKLHDTVNSLRFKKAEAGDKALLIDVGFTGLKQKKADTRPVPAFSADELQQWQTVWNNWERNLENSLSRPPLDKQTEANKALLREVLQDAGAAFEKGLTASDVDGNDPVRAFFNDSWDKLGPLLRNASEQLPGAEGLRYLTLIAATDLMYELESITAPLGLEISSNGLRKLARSYLSHEAGQGKG